MVHAETWITVILRGLPWKQTEIIISFLRLHPSTAFQTLVDYEGYCISSKGSLPTIVDTMVQFSRSVVSDSLRPHEVQHARPPCPSPTPRVYLNSCPLNRWCHPAISSSVIPFSSCPQSFPALESFQMSQLFASGDQSIGASASASVLPKHILGWFPLGLTYLIPLPSKGLSRGFYSTLVQKASIFQHSAFFMVQFSHPHMTTEKNHSFDYLDPCWQVDISAF